MEIKPKPDKTMAYWRGPSFRFGSNMKKAKVSFHLYENKNVRDREIFGVEKYKSKKELTMVKKILKILMYTMLIPVILAIAFELHRVLGYIVLGIIAWKIYLTIENKRRAKQGYTCLGTKTIKHHNVDSTVGVERLKRRIKKQINE